MLNLPYPISQNRYWRVRVINGVAINLTRAAFKAGVRAGIKQEQERIANAQRARPKK